MCSCPRHQDATALCVCMCPSHMEDRLKKILAKMDFTVSPRELAVQIHAVAFEIFPAAKVRPLGLDLDASAVQEVWDTFVKPQQDSGELQSVEDRILMAILRTMYAIFPAPEGETNE